MANTRDRAVADSSQRKERDAMTHARRAARTNERRTHFGGGRMGRFLVMLPILLLLATPISAVAAAEDDPATVVQRFFDARNRYDIDATLALVTDDVRFVGGPYCTPA